MNRGMKKSAMWVLMLVALLLGSVDAALAQEAVRLGDCTFVPEQNVGRPVLRSVRAARPIDLGRATGGRYNVLLQFETIPTQEEWQLLTERGVLLDGWVGGNAYWAQLPEGVNVQRVFAGTKVRSVLATRPEWKALRSLLEGCVPEWARRPGGRFAFILSYASNVQPAQLVEALKGLGALDVSVDAESGSARGELPVARVRDVAALDYVQQLQPVAPPSVLDNAEAAQLGGATALSRPDGQWGRSLTGKGVRVGIWDGNVEPHPDFGDRVTHVEFERDGDDALHGTHVAGTMFGSGLQDARGRGMAPEAKAWAHNFGKQKNGTPEYREMRSAGIDNGVTVSQNSYGYSLSPKHYKEYYYKEGDKELDGVCTFFPSMAIVYSAGNDQQRGGKPAEEAYGDARYGTSTKRSKNAILVGALRANGMMTDFSSWGPMDDGRMVPTICAKGEDVYSTQPSSGYREESGTSMACPVVSGHVALLQERYRQLNRGEDLRSDLLRAALVTGATDAGAPGPDYVYGFGILNAERTLEILEKGYYHQGGFSIGATAAEEIKVKVPQGAKSMRVSLAWIDPPFSGTFAYGVNPLANDLDLKVIDAASVEHLPLVCDPKNVTEPAKPAVDKVNTIEQVVLPVEGGAEVTVAVVPTRVAFSFPNKQIYYVAYNFDYGDLRVVSPSAGDVVYPGEAFYLRLEGIEGPYMVELSTDGGATYKRIANIDRFDASKPYFKNVKVQLANTTPVTSHAKVRILSQDGRIAESAGEFSIAPRVADLTISDVACGTEGFVLRWKAIAAATKGYAVLRATEQEGRYVKIDDLASGITEYEIPKEELLPGALYTVAGKLDNDLLGPQAKAVIPYVTTPIILKRNEKLWQENFVSVPSSSFRVHSADNNRTDYLVGDHPAVPMGGHKLKTVIGKKLESFSYDKPFAPEHQGNMVQYDFCGLDLTDFPATTSLVLHLRVGMGWADANADRGPWFRVLLDGEPLQDCSGTEVHERLSERTDLFYRIAGGRRYDLAFQFVGKYNLDRLFIHQIGFESGSEGVDVGLNLVEVPASAAKLTANEKVKVQLYNSSAFQQERVGLQLLRNGEIHSQLVAEHLMAYERRTVELPVDLTMQKPLGEVFNIEVRAVVEGDIVPKNNSVKTSIANLGDVFAMPRGRIEVTPVGVYAYDPKLTYQLKDGERLLFTDDGGALQNYYVPQLSTLKVLPSREGRVVRVRFKEFSVAKKQAMLLVFNETVPSNLNVNDLFFDREMHGSNVLPYATTSKAADGALTFYFEALKAGAGWLAEIDEVPLQNPLTLVGATAHATGADPQGSVPVKLTVKNRYPKKIEGIALHYYNDDIDEVAEGGFAIEANETKEFTLGKALDLKAGELKDLKVWVECPEDTDGSDNGTNIVALYDVYPIAAGLKSPDAPSFDKLVYLDQSCLFGRLSSLSGARKNFPRYMLNEVLTLYKQVDASEVGIVGLKAEAGDAVRLWVDWDDSKSFDASELAGEYVVDASAELNKAKFAELVGLSGASAGVKRARVAVAKQDELQDPTFANSLSTGSVFDFTINVVDGPFPGSGDLALKGVKLLTADGAPLVTGENLPNNATIAIEVANNGFKPFDGKFGVQVDIDGIVTTEEVDIAAAQLEPIPALAAGAREIRLQTALDASAVGKHVVKVTIEEKPTVVNDKNNVGEESVYCVVPEGGCYALAFKSKEKEFAESVQLPAGYTGSKKQATIEFWAYLDKPQYATFIKNDEFAISSLYNMTGNLPDRSLGIVLSRGIFYTAENTLLPGRWNHVAVVLDNVVPGDYPLPGSCQLTVYINGEPQPVETMAMGATLRLASPVVGSALMGMVDEVRVWEDVRTQDEVRANMYRHVPAEERGELVYEFAFNEGPGNKLVFGTSAEGNRVEGVVHESSVARLQTKGELWYDLKAQAQCVSTSFEGQKHVEKLPGDTWRIFFQKGTDRTAVKGAFVTMWPHTAVRLDGQPVTPETTFDLSDGKQVTLTFESVLFGETITQTMHFEGVEDASDECELLTLSIPKDGNPGLQADLTVTQIAPSIVVASADAPTNPKAVKVNFTVSDGAKMSCNGVALSSGAPIDLSAPAVLTVTAANGRNSRVYSLRLAVKNSIAWTLTDLECTYRDAPKDAGVSGGVSGMPFESTSTNPQVATLVNGKVHVGLPGETTVTLRQSAGGMYAESNLLSAKITVKRFEVEATPALGRSGKLSCNEKYQWRFTYNPSELPPADLHELSDLHIQADYGIYDVDGRRVVSDADLIPGNYTVKAPVAQLQTEKYNIKLNSQALKVTTNSASIAVLFSVKDVASAELSGVDIVINKQPLKTDNKGKAFIILKKGIHTYSVFKRGYKTHYGVVTLVKDAVNCDITLVEGKYTLKYGAARSGGGFVYGEKEQYVPEGASGDQVEAVPYDGYRFVAWSDGVSESKRIDRDVKRSISVEAQFEKIELLPVYTITYKVEGGGMFTDGSTADKVYEFKQGEELPAVGVAPAYSGYYFVSWSDGNIDMLRPAGETAQADLTLVARFAPYATLPFSEDFEAGAISETWQVTSSYPDASYHWKAFKGILPVLSIEVPSYAAAIVTADSESPEEKLYGTTLRLPIFDMEGVKSDIQVEFDWSYIEFESGLELGYSIDGGPMTTFWKAKAGAEQLPYKSEKLLIPAADVRGANTLTLAFIYKSIPSSWWAVIDNVKIYPKDDSELTVTLVADPAGMASFTRDDAPVTSLKVKRGEAIPEFKTVPDNDYLLKGWLIDGVPADLKAYGSVTKDIELTALLVPNDAVTIAYGVEPTGAGHVMLDGKSVDRQQLVKGHDAIEVTAEPNAGFIFSHWTDNGSTTPARTDLAVAEDLRTTAIFTPQLTKIEFVVKEKGSGDALGGVTIVVRNAQGVPTIFTTGADGKVEADLPSGEYTYDASCDGYVPIPKTALEVGADPQTLNLEMEKKSGIPKLQVLVVDAETNEPINGALVEVGDKNGATGTQGNAALELIEGIYNYKVSCTGYKTVEGLTVEVRYPKSELRVALQKDAPIHDVHFVVTNEDGSKPLAKVAVQVGSVTRMTDANGRARLTLTEGTHTYKTSLQGYTSQSADVAVSASTPEVLVKMPQLRYTLTVLVAGSDNQPIEGATVVVKGKDINTGANGKVQFEQLTTGKYEIEVSKETYLPIKGRTAQIVNTDREVTIVLEKERADITFHVACQGQNVAEASIMLSDAAGVKYGPFRTDGQGKVIGKLLPGSYTYTVVAHGYATKSEKVECTAAAPVEISLDYVMVNFVITVTDEQSQPIAGVEVKALLQPDGAAPLTATTQDNGEATLTGQYGTYAITIEHKGYRAHSSTLKVDGDVVRETIVLEALIPVTFLVKSGSGAPVGDVTIAIEGGQYDPQQTSSEGVATFLLVKGEEITYSVTPPTAGYVTPESAKYTPQAPETIEITLSERATLEFVVSDIKGNPLAGVSVVEKEGRLQPAITDADGKVAFVDLLGTQAEFTFSLAGYATIADYSVSLDAASKSEAITLRRTYLIAYVEPANGKIEVKEGENPLSSGAVILEGQTLTIAVTPNDGYKLEALIVNGVKSADSPLTHEVAGNVVIAASFVPNSHEVTYSIAEGEGTISATVDGKAVSSGSTVADGAVVVFEVVPAPGYGVVSWQGATPSPESPLKATCTISAPTVVTVKLAPVSHTVVFTVASGNGSISVLSGGQQLASGDRVRAGSEITITATAASGSKLEGLKLNGQEIENNSTHTVVADVFITAAFSIETASAVESVLLQTVSVVPNPFGSLLTIRNASQVESYSIVSLAGSEMLRGQGHGEDELTIATGSLPAGAYIVILRATDGYRHIRVVKQE